MRRIVLLALLPLLVAGCAGSPREVGSLVGNQAPDFAVSPVGASVPWSLSAHRDTVVLLDLMGVNCAPCREQMPHLLKVAASHANASRFSMLSVDMASVYPGLGARNDSEIASFKAEYKAPWPFAPDPRGKIGQAYEPIALPTTVIVDARGVIRAKYSGPISEAQLEDAIAKAGT